MLEGGVMFNIPGSQTKIYMWAAFTEKPNIIRQELACRPIKSDKKVKLVSAAGDTRTLSKRALCTASPIGAVAADG